METDLGGSNGADGAINGRLKHLRRIGLGFRNLWHYIFRSPFYSDQLQAQIETFLIRTSRLTGLVGAVVPSDALELAATLGAVETSAARQQLEPSFGQP